MHFTTAFLAVLGFTLQTFAAPAADATAAVKPFTLKLGGVSPYAGLSLQAVKNGTAHQRLLVFRNGTGTTAHLSRNKGNYHTLEFNVGDTALYGAYLPDPGDGDGFVFNVDATYNFTQRSFGVGEDGTLYAKLHAARNQFLACPINVKGKSEIGLFFGNDELNGTLPNGCSTAVVQTA